MRRIEKPIIIIGCPRSGTTLLYTLLSKSKELLSFYNESRFLFRELYLEKEAKGQSFDSDKLDLADVNPGEQEFLVDLFEKHACTNRTWGLALNKVIFNNPLLAWAMPLWLGINRLLQPETFRLVEKTPRNVFKIELMNKLFPDAYFVFIRRDPRSNISSLMEGWKNRIEEKDPQEVKRMPRLNKELKLQNFFGKLWRFALPPGWQDFTEAKLEEVCAHQWLKSNEAMMAGMKLIPDERKLEISYEDLAADSYPVMEKICKLAELDFSPEMKKMATKPPQVNYLDSKPKADKWRKNEREILSVLPLVAPVAKELGYDLEALNV